MKKYKVLFNKLESIILMFCIVCVFCLIISQGFFRKDTDPVFLNYNQLEQEIGSESNMGKEFGYVILKIDNVEFADIAVLINGESKYKFEENTEIKLKVHNNDIIGLDSSMYGKSTKIKIVGISKNVIFPKLNTEVITNSSLDVLGTVILN
ncbi:hypothetical protein [Brassicibacter mesophilus]|uniref:hypothetical protein n=1 Tax=Brassicibacter mesophilus TaxID=745119 RepID=UPI003D1D1EF9